MEGLDIKKVLGETPTNVFESIELTIKAQQQVLSAISIMDSFLKDHDNLEYHIENMKYFLNQFKK